MTARRYRRLVLFAVVVTAVFAAAAGAARAAPAAAPSLPSGDITWHDVWNPTTSDDVYTACAPGAAGACFAAGFISPVGLGGPESVVAKYDVDGDRLWTDPWMAPNCIEQRFYHATGSKATDTAAFCGTCIQKGSAHYDWLVTKYDGGGTRLWGVIYSGPGTGDQMTWAVVTDKAGNVYAAGNTITAGGSDEITVVKFAAADGAVVWAAHHDRPYTDWAHDLVIDGAGNLYVAGFVQKKAKIGLIPTQDGFVGKVNPDGTWAWAHRVDGPTHRFDELRSVVVCRAGVYVAGVADSEGADPDVLIARYTRDGAHLWTHAWGNSLHQPDWVLDLAVDSAGTAWTAGYTERATAPDHRGLITRWSAAGVRKGSATLDPAGASTTLQRVIVTSDRIAYFGGTCALPPAYDDGDWIEAKYSAKGTHLWDNEWEHLSGSLPVDNSFTDMTTADDTTIIMVGDEADTPGDYGAGIARFMR